VSKDERDSLPQPHQPLGTDADGVLRFKQNKIVRFLLDEGPFDMNKISMMDFSNEDRTQFAQRIRRPVLRQRRGVRRRWLQLRGSRRREEVKRDGMKVVMDEKDINEACVEWLKQHHALVVKDGNKCVGYPAIGQHVGNITFDFEVTSTEQPYR
jgi:hypothetical protein